jgi:hypothetical protein
MIGDKAYDSDPVAQRLFKEHGMELIDPNKKAINIGQQPWMHVY